jgi:hypothetical protein
MNSYSPIFDAWGMVVLAFSGLVLVGDLALGWYFGRKGRELMRRGGMWGGQ